MSKVENRISQNDWDIEQARNLYGINRWGNGYYDINEQGEVVVNLNDGDKLTPVSLHRIIQESKQRGRDLPLLLRFRDLLGNRIEKLHSVFQAAIEATGYRGCYRGVYPIKVNQQQQVIEEVTEFGRNYHYGLEAGSKPELIAALAYMHDREAFIVCNGYKDDEFIDLALRAKKMGLRVVIIIEMPGELPAVIARAKALGIRPTLGVRFRLSTKSEGHWAESGGDRSVFGLNSSQLIDVVDLLKKEDYLDCLTCLHYHQGSQLPNIRTIREAATEAVRVYVSLVQEGAPMGVLDMGGGLAVDYGGGQQNVASSCNYSLQEYARDLVEIVQQQCELAEVPHPDIVTESGRAIVAYYSVLVFNILDVTYFENNEQPEAPPADAHEMLHNLWEVQELIEAKTLQECFNDAIFYRDQTRALFRHGVISLRERSLAEKAYWYVCTQIAIECRKLDRVPEDLQNLESNLIDFYHANFSVFQSLPDAWAIDQIFPTMPLHKLDEEPTRRAILADITCDCDGKIDRFIDAEGTQPYLPVHEKKLGEEYNIGAFLVGAYQETLGDLHNLLGDTHVVSVSLEDGELVFTNEVEGDSVADVLSYVEYDPKDLEKRFRNFAESAVRKGNITASERKEMMHAFREGLSGYTYYEA